MKFLWGKTMVMMMRRNYPHHRGRHLHQLAWIVSSKKGGKGVFFFFSFRLTCLIVFDLFKGKETMGTWGDECQQHTHTPITRHTIDSSSICETHSLRWTNGRQGKLKVTQIIRKDLLLMTSVEILTQKLIDFKAWLTFELRVNGDERAMLVTCVNVRTGWKRKIKGQNRYHKGICRGIHRWMKICNMMAIKCLSLG